MENVQNLLSNLPDTAKDVRLGLKSALAEEGSQGLTQPQIWGAALSAAITLRHPALEHAIRQDGEESLGEAGVKAAETAAALMGITNIYYHTVFHLMKDDTTRTMPAGIRMNASKSHGYDAVSYELFCFAASVIGQCGSCVNAHDKQLKDAGITREGIQSTVRLAGYLNGAAMMLK